MPNATFSSTAARPSEPAGRPAPNTAQISRPDANSDAAAVGRCVAGQRTIDAISRLPGTAASDAHAVQRAASATCKPFPTSTVGSNASTPTPSAAKPPNAIARHHAARPSGGLARAAGVGATSRAPPDPLANNASAHAPPAAPLASAAARQPDTSASQPRPQVPSASPTGTKVLHSASRAGARCGPASAAINTGAVTTTPT